MNRIDMIKEYAKNEQDREYINGLSDEVYNEVNDIMLANSDLEMKDIMECSLTHCVHVADFDTEYKINKQFPNATYKLLHEVSSNSDWTIERNKEEYTIATVSMSDEHYIIMSLLKTLDDMKEYIISNSVADEVIIINNKDNEPYEND